MRTGFRLAEALAGAATALHAAEGPEQTMDTAVALAREIVPGTAEAGITLIERGTRVRTGACTTEAVRAVDAAQRSGPQRPAAPYWEALWERPVVRREDTARDPATEAAAKLGLRSLLSLRLSSGYRRLSILNLYASGADAFDDRAVRIGRLLAAHVSVALDSARVQEQLTEAMHTRDVIGQATGVLMAKLDLDAREAFRRLVRASQQENVKVRDIAFRVVETIGGGNGERGSGID
ncbi:MULTISPECIES: ANTAR domain-containing protein [Streptomycetaceae]|nr:MULTISPECIES: ANTAR domain-containing protein [Streptomycetaceae]CCB74698.1 conserved protein of unknown function [Streptantibioticus cattleyicolor NRRL 8057 = DSM 46488]